MEEKAFNEDAYLDILEKVVLPKRIDDYQGYIDELSDLIDI